MGSFLRINDVITPATTPRFLAHSTGVAGDSGRWIAAQTGATSGIISRIPDVQGRAELTSLPAKVSTVAMARDTAAGITYANLPGGQEGALLLSSFNTAGPFTFAGVLRAPSGAEFFSAASAGGTGTSIGAGFVNGPFKWWASYNARTYSDTSLENRWSIVMGVFNGANVTISVDGKEVTSGTGTTTGKLEPLYFGTLSSATKAMHLAEAVTWPRALTAAERTTYLAAMRKHYPKIPA